MHLARKGGTKIYSSCYTLYPPRLSLSSLHHFIFSTSSAKKSRHGLCSKPHQASENMRKMGCVHADRPSGKSSVEKHSWDTCWLWLMRIPGKAFFHSLLGKLRKWFPCLFMKFLLYVWDSEHLVHTGIERHCCHLGFMGFCHASCTGSQNHTPTPGVHTCWPGSSGCLENTDSSLHLLGWGVSWGKALCGATTAEPTPQKGSWHCPLIQTVLAILFSSPLWTVLGLIVPRVHPN